MSRKHLRCRAKTRKTRCFRLEISKIVAFVKFNPYWYAICSMFAFGKNTSEDFSLEISFPKNFLYEDRRNLKMKKKILTLTIGLTALAFAGCESTTPNSNTAANRPNSNQAVVVNNNGNTTVVSTTNTSSANRWNNSNITREEYDKNKAEYEKDKGNSKIGTGANDGWLWTKTRLALLTTADLRESTIDVDVDNAVVTLRGSVASAAEKTKAEQVAKGIDGVKSVSNKLTVAPKDSMTNTGGGSSNSKSSNTATNKK